MRDGVVNFQHGVTIQNVSCKMEKWDSQVACPLICVFSNTSTVYILNFHGLLNLRRTLSASGLGFAAQTNSGASFTTSLNGVLLPSSHPEIGNILRRSVFYLELIFCSHLNKQEWIPVGCVPSAAVAVCWGVGGVCPGEGVCLPNRGVGVCPGGSTPAPLWTDRHLWKHNLSATTVPDGKKKCYTDDHSNQSVHMLSGRQNGSFMFIVGDSTDINDFRFRLEWERLHPPCLAR